MGYKDDFWCNLPLELSQALFRIIRPINRPDFKRRIEIWSIRFLEAATLSDLKSAARSIKILEKLVILAETTGEIPYQASKVLYTQFEIVKSAIRQYEAELVADSAIDSFFSVSENNNYESQQIASTPHFVDINELKIYDTGRNYESKTDDRSSLLVNKYDSSTITDRQKLIISKIRQLGNAAMKDLIAEFPSVSERTIRYDLQKLCDGQILERRGSSGPSSFYCLRTESLHPISA